jgi:hypothetical protein
MGFVIGELLEKGTRFENFDPRARFRIPSALHRVGRRNTLLRMGTLFQISLWFLQDKGGDHRTRTRSCFRRYVRLKSEAMFAVLCA